MKIKKEKPKSITAVELLGNTITEYNKTANHVAQFSFSKIEVELFTKMMVDFAKSKVPEALHETSEHFKNPENVSYIKNNYNLDKIV